MDHSSVTAYLKTLACLRIDNVLSKTELVFILAVVSRYYSVAVLL